jgi:hypothetical protein
MQKNEEINEYCSNTKCSEKLNCKRYMQFLKNIGVVENFNYKTVNVSKIKCSNKFENKIKL